MYRVIILALLCAHLNIPVIECATSLMPPMVAKVSKNEDSHVLITAAKAVVALATWMFGNKKSGQDKKQNTTTYDRPSAEYDYSSLSNIGRDTHSASAYKNFASVQKYLHERVDSECIKAKHKQRLATLHNSSVYAKTYKIPTLSDSYLSKELSTYNGIALGHCLHQEFIEIAHIADKEQNLQAVCRVGVQVNKASDCLQACYIADFCWSVIDYAHIASHLGVKLSRGAVFGVAQGLYTTGDNVADMIVHPVQALTNFGKAVGMVLITGVKIGVYYAPKGVKFYVDVVALHNDDAVDRLANYVWQLDAIKDGCTRYIKEHPEDAVAHVASFATECYAFGQLGKALCPVLSKIKQGVIACMEHAMQHAPQLRTAEGILLSVGEGAKAGIREIPAMIPALPKGWVPKYPKILESFKPGRVIKEFLPRATKEAEYIKHANHTFGYDHVKDGICLFGQHPDLILDEMIKLIIEADLKGLIKMGDNQINVIRNSRDFAIKVNVLDGKVRSFDGFIRWSDVVKGNLIEM